MIVVLVAYWRADTDGRLMPGDFTVAFPLFLATDVEVEALRDMILEDLQKRLGPCACRAAIANIVRLGG